MICGDVLELHLRTKIGLLSQYVLSTNSSSEVPRYYQHADDDHQAGQLISLLTLLDHFHVGYISL
jgi:hypothetical protein